MSSPRVPPPVASRRFVSLGGGKTPRLLILLLTLLDGPRLTYSRMMQSERPGRGGQAMVVDGGLTSGPAWRDQPSFHKSARPIKVYRPEGN